MVRNETTRRVALEADFATTVDLSQTVTLTNSLINHLRTLSQKLSTKLLPDTQPSETL
jgi:hypothetical protein